MKGEGLFPLIYLRFDISNTNLAEDSVTAAEMSQ